MAAKALALVTGAAGGIGTGVCALLAERGYRIIAVERDQALADQAAAKLVDAIPVACDIGDRAQVLDLCRRIKQDWGADLEVLVCNAGVIVPGDAADSDPDEMANQIDVMLTSVILMTAAAANVMRVQRRGHILCTVSMGGLLPLAGSATYSAAKAGLRAYLTALQGELRAHKVRVSGIYPTAVNTKMLEEETRHGGSLLNFVGKVLSVDDVVAGYRKALRTGQLEVLLPYLDGLATKVVAVSPAFLNRLVPQLEKLGRRGYRKYAKEHGIQRRTNRA